MTKIQSFDGEARPSDPKESADKGESGAGSDGKRDTAPERVQSTPAARRYTGHEL